MRDGRFVARAPTADADAPPDGQPDGRARARRPVSAARTRSPTRRGAARCRCEGFTRAGLGRGRRASRCSPGEILGFAGLVGAGRTELFEGLLGLRPHSVERIELAGRAVRIAQPARGRRPRPHLPERRPQGQGPARATSACAENLTLMALERYAQPWLQPRRRARGAGRRRSRTSASAPARSTSRAVVAVGRQPAEARARQGAAAASRKVVVLDEPTRGVDVGAKRDIYFLIQRLAREGLRRDRDLVGADGADRPVPPRRGDARRPPVRPRSTREHLTEEELIAHATGTQHDQPQPPQRRRDRAERRPRWAERLHGLGPVVGLVLLCIAGTLLNSDFATARQRDERAHPHRLHRHHRGGHVLRDHLGRHRPVGRLDGGADRRLRDPAHERAGGRRLARRCWRSRSAWRFAVVLGALFGLAHGLLITRGRIEPFIVTLGTLGIFRAYLTYFADGGAHHARQRRCPTSTARSTTRSLLGVPIPVVGVRCSSRSPAALILNRTAYGRYVQAIGSNEQVARYAAVDVDRVKVLTYVLLGVCVGIATLLYVPRLGSASPTTGLLWELEAIAAVIVGGTALQGRRRQHHRHRGRRGAALGHQQHPEPHQHHQRVPQRRGAGLRDHRRRVPAAAAAAEPRSSFPCPSSTTTNGDNPHEHRIRLHRPGRRGRRRASAPAPCRRDAPRARSTSASPFPPPRTASRPASSSGPTRPRRTWRRRTRT